MAFADVANSLISGLQQSIASESVQTGNRSTAQVVELFRQLSIVTQALNAQPPQLSNSDISTAIDQCRTIIELLVQQELSNQFLLEVNTLLTQIDRSLRGEIKVDQKIHRSSGLVISGTIAAGGTAQVAIIATPGLNYLEIQNISSSPLWLNFGADAQEGLLFKILPDGSWHSENWLPNSFVSIFGTTAGQKYSILKA
jgi:hypothetical protein